MIRYLWRWSHAKDDWTLITSATADKCAIVLRGNKRRDEKGARYKWTDSEVKPKKFRTRSKKSA